MRFSRWAKSGVLQKAFERLAQEHLYAPLCWGLDSTSVKVHPDGCGALVGLWMAYGQRKGGTVQKRCWKQTRIGCGRW